MVFVGWLCELLFLVADNVPPLGINAIVVLADHLYDEDLGVDRSSVILLYKESLSCAIDLDDAYDANPCPLVPDELRDTNVVIHFPQCYTYPLLIYQRASRFYNCEMMFSVYPLIFNRT